MKLWTIMTSSPRAAARRAEQVTLRLADTPEASRMAWRRDDDPRVAVEVAATGPKVVTAGARSADRVVFALVGSSAGADRDQARTSGRHLVEDVLPAFAIT